MKVRELIDIIENDGWYLVATKGSHRQFKHPLKSGKAGDRKLCRLIERTDIHEIWEAGREKN